MRKISKKYSDFINESLINLILEANINYETDFKDILSNIDSPLKSKILDIENKEVDINQNYIDIILDKDDTVSFLQDDRVNKIPYNLYSNTLLTVRFNSVAKYLGYELTNYDNSDDGKCQLIREIKLGDDSELDKHFKDYFNAGYRLYLIKYNYNGNVLYNVTYNLERSAHNIKRGELKIGRFVRALLKKADVEFSNKEIEDFVNKYKSEIKLKNESFNRFEEVKGEDIKHWYLENNYFNSEAGTLGNSCMRYKKCQYFFDIYTENTDKVSLIILKHKELDYKICGRALLWTTDNGKKIMDRIYVNDSSDTQFFIQYANSKNYYYKYTQNYESLPLALNNIKLSNDESIFEITLNVNFDKYPYMDTFKYLNINNSTINNNPESDYTHELVDTNGGNGSCDTCGGSGYYSCEDCNNGEIECDECYGNGEIDCRYCDGSGYSYCVECEGNGEVECESCDGEGCDICNNSGIVKCESCYDGEVKCEDCNGKGEIDCSYCDGRGEIECGSCDGSGNIECYECNN